MNRILDVDIKTVMDDDTYFGDLNRFGSTEYAEYIQNKEIGLAMLLQSRSRLESGDSAALLFGKIVHECIHDTFAFLKYVPSSSTLTTTQKGYEKGELGKKDYFILQHFLSAFPIDLQDLKNTAELYQSEVGYFIDIVIYDAEKGCETPIKFRCKPDLAFRLPLDPMLYIIDWKTMSKFGGSDFAVKYALQGELYANLMFLITGCSNVQHINYIFEKDHPYRQYDLDANIFSINDGVQQKFLNNAIKMHEVLTSYESLLGKNASINNDILKCFMRKK